MTRIGFIGYSTTRFNEDKAKEIIDGIFESFYGDEVIISGATNFGIPKLVYEKANECGMYTIGVMCNAGFGMQLARLNDLIVEGQDWGDESEKFLSMLDVLYKIGGGNQSITEFEKAKELGIEVHEYEL